MPAMMVRRAFADTASTCSIVWTSDTGILRRTSAAIAAGSPDVRTIERIGVEWI